MYVQSNTQNEKHWLGELFNENDDTKMMDEINMIRQKLTVA